MDQSDSALNIVSDVTYFNGVGSVVENNVLGGIIVIARLTDTADIYNVFF